MSVCQNRLYMDMYKYICDSLKKKIIKHTRSKNRSQLSLSSAMCEVFKSVCEQTKRREREGGKEKDSDPNETDNGHLQTKDLECFRNNGEQNSLYVRNIYIKEQISHFFFMWVEIKTVKRYVFLCCSFHSTFLHD